MKLKRTFLIVPLILFFVSVPLSQNRNSSRKQSSTQQTTLSLRERLQMTKDSTHTDEHGVRTNLAKRLGCPLNALADDVTIVGEVLLNTQIDVNGLNTHAKLVNWMSQLKNCDDYEKADDLDLTFTVDSLTADSQKTLWDHLGILHLDKIEAELVPCARSIAGKPIFEGWRDESKNVMFKDLSEATSYPFWRGGVDEVATRWEKVKSEQCLSVRGALVIDDGNNCSGTPHAPEIHPVYEIKLLPDTACP